MRFTTKSGATYRVEDNRVMRETGPYSPGIAYDLCADGEWSVPLVACTEITVGERVTMDFIDGTYRITTSVVSIEENE